MANVSHRFIGFLVPDTADTMLIAKALPCILSCCASLVLLHLDLQHWSTACSTALLQGCKRLQLLQLRLPWQAYRRHEFIALVTGLRCLRLLQVTFCDIDQDLSVQAEQEEMVLQVEALCAGGLAVEVRVGCEAAWAE